MYQRFHNRQGKALILFAVALPAVLGIVGIVVDGGMFIENYRLSQHVVDSAATAAAMDLRLGKSVGVAKGTGANYVGSINGLSDAQTVVNSPPITGVFAGRSGFVEVTADRTFQSRLIQVFGGSSTPTYQTRAVAGLRPVTKGAVIVVLDPKPAGISIISGLPNLLSPRSSLLAGFEVEGLGNLKVNGAILVNTEWGGFDENRTLIGDAPPLPYGMCCTPLTSLTRVWASDIRVSGGVDNPSNYKNIDGSSSSPLHAGRLAVPDPLKDLVPPSAVSDPNNVSTATKGGVSVVQIPLISPPVVLSPGVYDWIEVVTGTVTFSPGIYIIRGKNPITGISLNVLAGTVNSNGAMFYITDSSNYSAATGSPDSTDGSPAPLTVPNLLPSVVIQSGLLGGGFTPLDDPSSPYDGMLFYQRRVDRRPIIIVCNNSLLSGSMSGLIYAKYGHVSFVSGGTFDLRFVVGTLRIATVLDTTLQPSSLLPPAYDVHLVE